MDTEQNGEEEILEPTGEEQVETEEVGGDEPPAEEEQPPAAPSVDEVARQIGWVPREQYKGDPDKWRPAHEFIIAGRDIQQRVSSELREVKQTLDVVARTNASIVEERIAQETARLRQQFAEAVENGDPNAAFRISRRLNEVEAQAQPAAPVAPPTVQEWMSQNKWFSVHPRATALAQAVSHEFQHLDAAAQLQKAEEEVRRVYPELFGPAPAPQPPPQPKPQAQVSTAGSRSAASAPRAKGFADMPKAFQDVARDMANRGAIPSVDVYARHYWANEKG